MGQCQPIHRRIARRRRRRPADPPPNTNTLVDDQDLSSVLDDPSRSPKLSDSRSLVKDEAEVGTLECFESNSFHQRAPIEHLSDKTLCPAEQSLDVDVQQEPVDELHAIDVSSPSEVPAVVEEPGISQAPITGPTFADLLALEKKIEKCIGKIEESSVTCEESDCSAACTSSESDLMKRRSHVRRNSFSGQHRSRVSGDSEGLSENVAIEKRSHVRRNSFSGEHKNRVSGDSQGLSLSSSLASLIDEMKNGRLCADDKGDGFLSCSVASFSADGGNSRVCSDDKGDMSLSSSPTSLSDGRRIGPLYTDDKGHILLKDHNDTKAAAGEVDNYEKVGDCCEVENYEKISVKAYIPTGNRTNRRRKNPNPKNPKLCTSCQKNQDIAYFTRCQWKAPASSKTRRCMECITALEKKKSWKYGARK